MPQSRSGDLALVCSCGALRGALREVSPDAGNRCVCYCDDCQAFLHHLGRGGELLDDWGGTEIFQTSSGRLVWTDGVENVACLRLTDGGMLRWYSRCCNTPIGNTFATARIPFVGLILACLADADSNRTARDERLGPIRMRGFAAFARGDGPPPESDEGVPPRMGERVGAILEEAVGRRDAERSPFFPGSKGEPVAPPHVLSDAELRAARQAAAR